MVAFNHLHTHSYYSFLEGLPSPSELVAKAANFDMPALALTDRISMSGSIEFYLACREVGIQPILGLQIPVSPPLEVAPIGGDLILLARDLTGWRSLCRLSSAMQADASADSITSLPFSDFAQETKGLICLTGGNQGNLDQLIREGQDQAARRYL